MPDDSSRTNNSIKLNITTNKSNTFKKSSKKFNPYTIDLRKISVVKRIVKIKLRPDWNYGSWSGAEVSTIVLRTTSANIILSYALLYIRIAM